MNKYLKAASLSFVFQTKERSALFGKIILYIIIVYLFDQIFVSVDAPSSRIWYFGITQAIILATMPLAFQIDNDMKSNQVSYFLIEPVNYLSFRYLEAIGASFFRYIILVFLCFSFLSYLKQELLTNKLVILFSIFLGTLSIILYTQISLFIGILSYWIKDIKIILYLNLTATFCFGGLIVPIQFYPPLMQKICFLTPYPWILWWPANYLSTGSADHQYSFMIWILWNVFFVFLNRFLFNKFKKQLIREDS